MNDDAPGKLTDPMVIHYVQHGATPRAVEHAFSRSGVRILAAQIEAREDDIRALADRWGIKRQGILRGE